MARRPHRKAARQAEFEVLVLGAGPAGLTLAVALAGAGVSVAAIDRADPHRAAGDGRTTAIAAAGKRLLAAVGVWPALDPVACPIDDIRVTDGDAPVFLHYDHRALGQGPLGWIVDNPDLRRALLARAAALPRLRLAAPVEVRAVERAESGVVARLADGQELRAPVVIGCDGRNSWLRRDAGIAVTRWSYGQSALVCIARHERPHRHVAHERFLPAGPFAILPMCDDAAGRHRSSIVWTERSELAPLYLALPEAEFDAELGRRFGDFLGPVGVAGPRFAHPLGLQHAERYVAHRMALAGDAAHVIHPVAGQGFNLGLRDVAALAEVLVEAKRLGLDLGHAAVLADYQRLRRFDNFALAVMTDGLVRLFSNSFGPARLARDLGLAAVERLPALKRFLMRQAMGLAGELPRLLRGEAL